MKAVAAAFIVQGGAILIAKRSGDALAGCWEFPGGKVEENETPRACLQREILEELGIHVKIGEHLGDSVYQTPEKSVHLHLFRAEWSRGRLRINEHETIRWVTPDRLGAYRFAPADLPFVNRLISGDIPLEAGQTCSAD
jgi:8-oxo-dGTP diphosphatase